VANCGFASWRSTTARTAGVDHAIAERETHMPALASRALSGLDPRDEHLIVFL